MRHLHPLVWVLVGASLIMCSRIANNPLFSLLIILTIIGLSVLRRGDRLKAFLACFAFSALLIIFRIITSVIVGNSSDGQKLLFLLPKVDFKTGVSFGGPYTVEKLFNAISNGLLLAIPILVLGLIWQASASGQLCDLAYIFFGRGSRLLAPILCFGEAISQTRHHGGVLKFWAAAIYENQQIVQSWNKYSAPSVPKAKNALIAGMMSICTLLTVITVSYGGGIKIGEKTNEIVITGWFLLKIFFATWLIVKLFFTGRKIISTISWLDVLAIVFCLVLVAVAYLAPITGDIVQLNTPVGEVPSLPIVLGATLGVSLVCWIGCELLKGRSHGQL